MLTLVAVLGACAGWYLTTGDASVKTTGSGLQVMVGERTRSSDEALVGGKVTKVGKCIGLGGDLVIWPHGTDALSGDRIRVGGTVLHLGDNYSGAGGYRERNGPGSPPLDVDAPGGCPVTDTVVVLGPPG